MDEIRIVSTDTLIEAQEMVKGHCYRDRPGTWGPELAVVENIKGCTFLVCGNHPAKRAVLDSFPKAEILNKPWETFPFIYSVSQSAEEVLEEIFSRLSRTWSYVDARASE